MVLIEGTCTFGGGLLRRGCGAEPSGQCVYCGEPFCAEHGEHGEDYHEVCMRSNCQEKYRDVHDHQAWIRQQRPLNDMSMCADDSCGERMLHACQRCDLRFCAEHVQRKEISEHTLFEGKKRVMLLLCTHCAERRRIWD